MNKVLLERFINKYSLGDSVQSVILTIKDNVLTTEFITPEKSLLGKLALNDFQFEDIELGIYNTAQFSRMLNVLGEDVKLNVLRSEDTAISVKLEDVNASINYMLSDKTVIPQVPEMKNVPEFQLTLEIDSNFVSRFIASKNALTDKETFTIVTDKDRESCDCILGYSSINSDRITIPVNVDQFNDMDLLSFNADLFGKILQANKECSKGKLEISAQGLARVTFKVDNYHVVYNLVATQSAD
jgi:hypothetical protein|tara:strand:+ start:984 stop:1709 length:726 start_codon:yes stop_codon:yes gene_type:complete